MDTKLDLGWCQGYMGLKYHMTDALLEHNINSNYSTWCPDYALFSYQYYNQLNNLNHNKIHDFCFIGSINSNYQARQWVIDFAKQHFTPTSIFINTDNLPTWQSLGAFDYSNTHIGYNPKNMPDNQSRKVQFRTVQENKYYFETMCQSKFVLCPAGDTSWSFRFYETLMCKSIPIVETWHHTYRTTQEATINYKYVLYNNLETIQNLIHNPTIYNDYLDENNNIFQKYHMIN
jgi:hypothetical protein